MASNDQKLNSLNLPFKTRLMLSVISIVTDSVRSSNGTINRRVLNFFERLVPASSTPRMGVSTHDVTVDPTTDVTFRLFVPHQSEDPTSLMAKTPVMVFFHGGGFAFLRSSSPVYDEVCRRFARELNVVVCSVDYRRTPEFKFPAQYDDAFLVLKFLDEKRREIEGWPKNADVSRCFIAGDSAGGNISHHLAVRASSTEFSNIRIIGLINIQPYFGGKEKVESMVRLEGAPIINQARNEWGWKTFMTDEMDMDHWAINVSGLNAVDISSVEYPPTILIIGGFDPLRDWQKRYYDWLKTNGKDVKLVDYPTAIHAFYALPHLKESDSLFADVKNFINLQCSKL